MKKTVWVERTIAAPREQVFDTFTQHQTYAALAIVSSSTLLQPGQGNASNGVGAIREIKTPAARFREKVTACARPDYWDYHFIHWPLPLAHAGGRMSFTEVPGGTQVRWQTSYELPPTLAWKLASGAVDVFIIGLLQVLIRLLGQQALKREPTAR